MQKFLLMLVVLLGFTVVGHAQSTSATSTPGSAPAQPIAFNHKQHMETAKMSCNDCHEPRGNGTTLAMPQPPKCMTCHTSIAADKPDIKRLADAAKNEDPIPWVRVYRVPSFVTFSHKTHTTAGATCEDCHGPVAERAAITLEKQTNMGTCIACHQAKGAPATCDTCHAIMSKKGHSPFDVDATVLARLHIPSQKSASPVTGQPSTPHMATQYAVVSSFLYAPML